MSVFALCFFPFIFYSSHSLQAQPVSGYDCDPFMTILQDAGNGFDTYTGELIYDDGYEETYTYNYSLWDDDGRNMYWFYEEFDVLYTEFYYQSTYDLDEATTFCEKLVRHVKECLPAGYYQSKDHSEYSLVLYQFSDERDAGNLNAPAFPQVEVSVEKEEDYYYVMITFIAPSF